jgi:agmatinase
VGVTMADVGDVAIAGAEVERNLDRITEVVRRLVDRGSLVVAVGGDHSISYPVARGAEALGPIDVVHVDAHPDFADEYFGARFSHGSQLRRISELPFVRSVTAFGLRNATREDMDPMLSIVPGTTLPEPGGLSYRELRATLVEIARRGRVVGFDIVELNSPYDAAGATSRVTTWAMTHFLSEIFDSEG